ncbi:hypothetical protein [Nocardioides sp. T2.26MG-1]|uniref:hypothetical protein n=1 Tax=Nocardioides sp. T2.26MG-1 TaxID=3041166 RepID=UPI002477BD5E|nr:hypothetical protein [Nocardioides sp. T2.26MG-1]CAI9409687.1 hypothetical protein HIDPHFAB_01338 [Nocardioides sp. T2.26MG-1]
MPAEYRPHDAAPRDEGSAIIMVLMVLLMLTALGATLTAVTVSNLQGSRRSNEATRVLAAAEAGVAQAVTFMRQNGVSTLRCRDVGTPASPSWTDCDSAYGANQAVGPAVPAPGGARFSAWVEERARFLATRPAEGVYVVHSTGTVDGATHASCQGVDGPCRSVTAKVVVTNFGFGTGIYAKTIQGNSSGNATITGQSVFTTGCFPMRGRSSLKVTGFDAAHGIPAGVHTSGLIVDGPASWCDTPSRSIHAGDAWCEPAFPFDQDALGGSLAGTPCWTDIVAKTPGGVPNDAVFGPPDPDDPANDRVWGSRIVSQQGMQDTFGLAYPPLTDDQVERLKEIAEEDETYTTSVAWPTATATRGVYFFDLGGPTHNGRAPEVDLSQIPAPFNTESGACTGAVVIIRNGNAVISPSDASAQVGASVFLLSPGGGTGVATLNGGQLWGGLFAEAIDFSGNTSLEPATCTGDGSNPALLTMTVSDYSEED